MKSHRLLVLRCDNFSVSVYARLSVSVVTYKRAGRFHSLVRFVDDGKRRTEIMFWYLKAQHVNLESRWHQCRFVARLFPSQLVSNSALETARQLFDIRGMLERNEFRLT